MPEDMVAPVMSNFPTVQKYRLNYDCFGWLKFYAKKPSDILCLLERATCFEPMPATLVKFRGYAFSAHPIQQVSCPAKMNNHVVEETLPIAPIWIKSTRLMSNRATTTMHCFMMDKKRRPLHIIIEVVDPDYANWPILEGKVTNGLYNNVGNRLRSPRDWENIMDGETCIAIRSEKTHIISRTSHNLGAEFYWSLTFEQSEFDMPFYKFAHLIEKTDGVIYP